MQKNFSICQWLTWISFSLEIATKSPWFEINCKEAKHSLLETKKEKTTWT